MTDAPAVQTPDLEALILDLLAEGRSLRSICKLDGMPSEATVRRWAIANREAFGDRMERARVLGCYELADEVLRIADAARDKDSAAAARVQCDSRKWLLSKMLPQTFGDRLEVQHSGSISIAGLLSEARQRRKLIDAVPEPVEAAMVEWVEP